MSVTTIISALQQGSAADLNFVSEMRHGLNEILDDMEDVCHRRGDSLHELEEEMQDNGHLLRSDLVNEVEALKREKRALTEELDSLRAQSETMRSVRPTTKRNVTQARKALAEAVSAVKSNTEIAYAYFASKRDEMESELNADAITTGNLQAAELNSTELKQSLTNLVEMITSSGNLDAAQNLIIATRRSADVHKCLITEKESVGKRWDKHYDCTIMTPKYLTLLLEGILSLQEVSAELSKRNGEGSGQRRFDTE